MRSEMSCRTARTKNAKAFFEGECSAQRCYRFFMSLRFEVNLVVSLLMPERAAALRS